jgi:hypothetical protein
MGLQLIVQSQSQSAIADAVGAEAEQCEVFAIEGELWGISIPTKVLDGIGENQFRARLSTLSIYDLYEGAWRYA